MEMRFVRIASSVPVIASGYVRLFASARFVRIASILALAAALASHFASARFVRIASPAGQEVHLSRQLCLSAFRADCIRIQVIVSFSLMLCLSAFRADCIGAGRHKEGVYAPLPQRVSCGLHQKWSHSQTGMLPFASARFVRIASAKLHRYCAANLWNTL